MKLTTRLSLNGCSELVLPGEIVTGTEKENVIKAGSYRQIYQEMLTIRGEKKQEKEQNENGWYRMERQYGSYSR